MSTNVVVVCHPPLPQVTPLLSPIVLSHPTPGYHNIDLEMQSPTELNYQPPTPLRHDDFFSLDPASVDPSEHSSPVRPSDLSLPGTPSLDLGPASRDGKPPTVLAEDTSLGSHGVHGAEEASTEEEGAAEETSTTPLPLRDDAAQGELDVAARTGQREMEKETEAAAVALKAMREPEDWASEANIRPQAGEGGSGGVSGRAEEEEKQQGVGEEEEGEMTEEKLKSLLGDINLEEGLEDEEMTEERVQQILSQVQQAEKDLSSLAGWPGEQSGAGETTAEAGADAPKTQDSGEATSEKQQKR